VNYRGFTSYGRAFRETLTGEWGGPEVTDLRAGVDWAVESGRADPDRPFRTGFSRGGVHAADVMTETDRFAAAEHGVYDLRSSFGIADSRNWLEADFGRPWAEPAACDRSSPIADVGGIDTPLPVTAGENDRRCPSSQGEQLYVSVRRQGVDATFVLYEGEHHAVGAPDRAIHRIKRLTDWFERYDPATED
jgi:dipeptidyl aminopeptidase/acylaminoacyl peptidase